MKPQNYFPDKPVIFHCCAILCLKTQNWWFFPPEGLKCVPVISVMVSSTVWKQACPCGRGREKDPWLTWTGASSILWRSRCPVSHHAYRSSEVRCSVTWQPHTGLMGVHPAVTSTPWEFRNWNKIVLFRWVTPERTNEKFLSNRINTVYCLSLPFVFRV